MTSDEGGGGVTLINCSCGDGGGDGETERGRLAVGGVLNVSSVGDADLGRKKDGHARVRGDFTSGRNL